MMPSRKKNSESRRGNRTEPAAQLSTVFHLSIYGMAAFAAVMLALSEGAALPQGLTIPLAIVAYLLTERHKVLTLPIAWANVLGILALLLAASELLSDNLEARLLSGAHLLVYLSWIVLFHPKSERQYWWMIALSAMQVAVGSVLTQDGIYGVLLVLYLVFGIWTLSVFSLYQAREQFSAGDQASVAADGTEASSRAATAQPGGATFAFQRSSLVRDSIQHDPHDPWISPRFAVGTLAMAGASMAIAVVFFLLIPRVWIGKGLIRDTTSALPLRSLSGFSERVELGAMGDILESTEPVLDARIVDMATGEPISVEAYSARLGYDEPLFRGAVMDYYENGSWSMTGNGRTPQPLDDNPPYGSVRQIIRRRPIRTDILFAIHPVTALWIEDSERGASEERDAPPRAIRQKMSGVLLGPRRERPETDLHYVAYSPRHVGTSPAAGPPAMTFDESPRFVRHALRRYRQLPDGLDRLAAEARRVAGEGTQLSDSERASRLVTYLRDSGRFHYSLSAEVQDASIDPVEDFLFNRKSGHCEYYAASLALMLRSLDIPARVVNGFKGGKTNRITRVFEVEQRHAHAWVEAWIDDQWVVLDATPAARADSVEALSANLPTWIDFKSFVRDLWSRYFVNINIAQQRAEFYVPLKEATLDWWESMQNRRTKASDVARAVVQFLSSPRRWFSWQGGVATFVILLLFSGIVWSARKLHALWKRLTLRGLQRRRRALVEFYERFERLCAAHGLVRAPSETPREFAAGVDLQLQNRQGWSDLDRLAGELARAFYRVRFGSEILSRDELGQIEARLARLERTLSAPESPAPAALAFE